MNSRILAAAGLAAATALLMAGTASAQTAPSSPGNFAVGIEGGTIGGGVTAQVRVGSNFEVRGSGDFLQFDHDTTYHNIPYRGQWHGMTGGAFVDWHPMSNAFMLTAGGYFGSRKLDINATPTGPVNIGGATFTPAEVGELTGNVRMSDAQPFVGLGFNNTFHTSSRLSFTGVLGVSFSSSPSVELNSTGGTLSNDPTFQTFLSNERAIIAHDVRNFKYYPIATIGVNYAF
jgi:hypothetical protein